MTIPATHAEIERLFISAESHQCQTVCITASNSGEGTSSIAQALCERYLLAGYRTLLIDLNMLNPSLTDLQLPESLANAGQLNETLVQHADSHRVFMGVVAPRTPSSALAIRDHKGLSHHIKQWLQHYDRIVFDTSPLLAVNKNAIPATVVAKACDGAYLMVLAGVTTADQIEQSCALLGGQQEGHLIGTLINYRNQPTLVQEIIREIDRFSWLPKRWTNWCKQKVITNHFLSLPI